MFVLFGFQFFLTSGTGVGWSRFVDRHAGSHTHTAIPVLIFKKSSDQMRKQSSFHVVSLSGSPSLSLSISFSISVYLSTGTSRGPASKRNRWTPPNLKGTSPPKRDHFRPPPTKKENHKKIFQKFIKKIIKESFRKIIKSFLKKIREKS